MSEETVHRGDAVIVHTSHTTTDGFGIPAGAQGTVREIRSERRISVDFGKTPRGDPLVVEYHGLQEFSTFCHTEREAAREKSQEMVETVRRASERSRER